MPDRPPRGLLLRCADERSEEFPGISVMGCLFRVPLHGDEEVVFRAGFQCLDDAVRRDRREPQTPAGIFYALVMRAPDPDSAVTRAPAGAYDRANLGAFKNINRVVYFFSGPGGTVFDRLGNLACYILVQLAAEGDIH